jgi:predicted PhzF superfamily epimerase YddE/YHI9
MSVRRINPRLAKLHRSYSVVELATLLNVHRHTVRNWIKAGLPVVDHARPVLILGSDFQDWWRKRRRATKRPLRPGQLYCFKCRQPSAPALGMVEYAATNAATGNLKAMCEACGTMMHRRARLASITALMPGVDVQRREAPPSISGWLHPSSNYDKATEG